MRDGEQECRLCGYPSRDCVLIPIPLTSKPMSHPVCRDCIEEITAMGAADGFGDPKPQAKDDEE